MSEPTSASEASIRWVADRFCQQTCEKDAPSGDAWALLEWVRKERSNEQHFFSTIYPRTLPAAKSSRGAKPYSAGRIDKR